MRTAVAVSLTAHAALLGWGLFALAAHPLPPTPAEAIPVSFVPISEVTAAPKAAQQVPPATPAPPSQAATAIPAHPAPPPPVQPQAPAKTAVSAPPSSPTVSSPTPSPAPKPVPPSATVVAAAQPVAPLPKPRSAPPAAPKPAAAAPEKAAPDPIAAVLGQSQPSSLPAPSHPATPVPRPQPAQPKPDSQALDSLITASTADARMTLSEVDALRAHIAACWTPPPGWTDPAEVRSVLIISLNPDGTVGAAPQVVAAPPGKYQQTAPESAVRAVLSCAPYSLPPEKYADWKQVQITFDPSAMQTG